MPKNASSHDLALGILNWLLETMPNQKKLNQRVHAKRRAKSRYGLDLNRERYQYIVEMIQSGRSRPVRQISKRVSIHIVQAFDLEMKVVYDKSRKTIVTFLPL